MGVSGRGFVAGFSLWFAAMLGLVGTGGLDTCTGGSADSLALGIAVLVLNLFGMLFLISGLRFRALALIVSLPMLAAAFYTLFTARLVEGVIHGATACSILLDQEFNMADGSEWTFAWQWTAASLIFWAGLAIAVTKSFKLRAVHDDPQH